MQGTSWAAGLELVGDDERLLAHAGLLPLRLLAERTGLRAGLSAAMRRRGSSPLYDRGQLLVDLALVLIAGGEAISDFRALAHLAPLIGPVPSAPTVWRALSEAGDLQLSRLNTAVTEFRRHWWDLLAARPEGFPWLEVAGRELTGVTVVDLDATIVFASSGKDKAVATYKGGIGFCPNLATCDNTDETLVIDPRPGNATSNCAEDNIAALDTAVSRLPAAFRRRILVRLDGAGFSHELLEHIAAGGGKRAGAGSSPSAGRAQNGRPKRSSGSPSMPASPRSTKVGRCLTTRSSLTSPACWTCRNGPGRSQACGSFCETSRCTRATASEPPSGRRNSAAATS